MNTDDNNKGKTKGDVGGGGNSAPVSGLQRQQHQHQQQQQQQTPPAGAGPSTPGTSYVYPVRSLLAGVQASSDVPKFPLPPGTIGVIGVPQSTAASDDSAEAATKRKEKEKHRLSSGSRAASTIVASGSPQSPWSSGRDSYFQPISVSSVSSAPASSPRLPLHPESTATASQSGTLVGESESLDQQLQKKVESVGLGIAAEKESAAGEEVEAMEVDDETLQEQEQQSAEPRGGHHTVILSGDRDPDEYNPRHPAPLAEAGADVLAATYTTPSFVKPKAMQALQPKHQQRRDRDHERMHASKALDFSQTGIVHLPPLPRSTSSASGSERGPSASGNFSGGSLSSAQARMGTGSAGRGTDTSASASNRANREREREREHMRRMGLGRSAGLGSGGSTSENPSASRSVSASASGGLSIGGTSGTDSAGDSAGEYRMQLSGSGMSAASSELVTFKFTYLEDDDGFHVLTGREGSLVKCEDEPIRAPGAVQGFGVMIVVEEDDDSGNLIVRQVSENATELLGLSPRYLFSLDCFTQTLPDSQADLLWDNVQFLHDSEYEQESETNDNPQVFLLSGWGEAGSAATEEEEREMEDNRRFWTCWCAAHRPPMPKLPTPPPGKIATGAQQPYTRALIVLEFELERDLYNPLYPPFQHEMMSTNSPDSQASSRSSKPGSGSTTATSFSRASGSSRSTNESTGGSQTEMNVRSPGSFTTIIGGGAAPLSPLSASAMTMSMDATQGVSSPQPLSSPEPSEQEVTSPAVAGTINPAEIFLSTKKGLEGNEDWFPLPEDIFESTTSHSKPLKALERMRRINRTFSSANVGIGIGVGADVDADAGLGAGAGVDDPGVGEGAANAAKPPNARQRARARRGGSQAGIGTMDIFAVLAQVNDQLSSAPDLETFLKVVVGVIKDLTQFHRVLVYQFDDQWNGQVVAELVDWRQTHDLYKGLHFPASDIPSQARELYRINKVRLLYDRSQMSARLVVRSKEDLEYPVDMTHSFLRAMSPIHIKYLANMGVRSSMSVSIITFGALWGLISCHSYGHQGMRVSFPVRQMLRLLSDSVSRNIERLSYAQRLRTRKLISTLPTDSHPTGYIVSNAEDLLGLFDADFGVLVIGEGAKILGPNQHGQEILLVAEYLRLKQFTLMQVSQSVVKDFPDLQLPSGLEVIAGLLCVPLSRGGKDFIAFLRKGQLRDVHWAGRPYKDGEGPESVLEPRKSFKTWSETIAGRCRAWTDEQLETAGVLALVYGKFIEVWRQKESALQTTQLTNLLLSNASHEVRTPLNHIINYLEMALNGPLDRETRENLSRSHSASKSLLFTINDLLVRAIHHNRPVMDWFTHDVPMKQDLTRLESGNETSFNEPFDLHEAITEAVQLYRHEATRRNLKFDLDLANSPKMVIGDAKKIRTVVANLTANAVKFTNEGTITVSCHRFKEPRGLRNSSEVAVEIVVGDTGCGIESSKLEMIFREFEQVEYTLPRARSTPGLGLGLAVVARIVEQLGGQLRVDSKPGEGSRFSFLIPFELADESNNRKVATTKGASLRGRSRTSSGSSEIESLVDAISSDHMARPDSGRRPSSSSVRARITGPPGRLSEGKFEVADSRFPIRSLKVDEFMVDKAVDHSQFMTVSSTPMPSRVSPPSASDAETPPRSNEKLRVLIAEDDQINRVILAKRLTLDGHTVVSTTNGQECVETVQADREFDCILMDIQMPLLNGFEAAKAIRTLEKDVSNDPTPPETPIRPSKLLNGRIPIFAVSASLFERQRDDMIADGIDGWILKPIEFKRLRDILKGILDPVQRKIDKYSPSCSWELGGWLEDRKTEPTITTTTAPKKPKPRNLK